VEQKVARSFVGKHAITDHLDRDFAFQNGVVGGIYHAHSAGAELPQDAIVAEDPALGRKAFRHWQAC
jgi:hypothetical protein